MNELKAFLDRAVDRINQLGFIENDPISIPHKFTKKQDIEIIGFWTAMLAWGQRVTIINKANELVRMMDGSPHDFIVNHIEKERKPFISFKHRTFNDVDALYFLEVLQQHYKKENSLETAFVTKTLSGDLTTEGMLIRFHEYFFDQPLSPQRTKKHIATPLRKSSCKRLNMFLRWMVRKDDKGVDFGLWDNIKPSQLIIPLDVHVQRTAFNLGLLERKQADWKAANLLTDQLRKMDPDDPVKYDFALFGLGLENNIKLV